jgi:hypothetical protein
MVRPKRLLGLSEASLLQKDKDVDNLLKKDRDNLLKDKDRVNLL